MRDFDSEDPFGPASPSTTGLIGWALRRTLVWGGTGFAIYLTLGYALKHLPAPSTSPVAAPAQEAIASAPASAAPRESPPNTLVYRADRNGHVVLEAAVNGAPVRFLVDTGATMVALTRRDAEAAGISPYDLVFDAPVSTANGVVRVAPVTLREVRLQQFTAYDVPAAVVENLSTSLLGMSFLNRLQSYQMQQGVLTMEW